MIEFTAQAFTTAAVIGLGFFWQDRRVTRFYRKIGERLDLIDARLAALSAHPNGGDPHVGTTQSRTNFEERPN